MWRKIAVLMLLGGVGAVLAAALSQHGQAIFTDQVTVTNNTFTTAACFAPGSFGAVSDTYVKEDKGGDDNFGTDDELKVKADSGKVKRALISFDVSSIPAGSTVTSATMTLCLSANPGASAQGRTEELRLVTSAWTETVVTWNDQPSVSAAVTDTNTVPTTAQSVNFTVTADVQSWVDGGANYGWRLADETEGTSSGDVKYASREHITTALRPRLAVTYVPP